MLHLLKLLKEMDPDGEGGDAVNSLINEFEEEVVQIEHRIQNKNLTCDGSDNGDDGSSSQLQDLPPDWIALEDPDSGDVYYANEVTGETTWDRPKVPKQLNQQQQTQDDNSQVSDNNNSEGANAGNHRVFLSKVIRLAKQNTNAQIVAIQNHVSDHGDGHDQREEYREPSCWVG